MFIVWAFIEVYLVHKAGTVAPTTDWLELQGTGAWDRSARAMVIAVASIAGWDGGIYVNEEPRIPRRIRPRAVVAVVILGVIFVSMFATFQESRRWTRSTTMRRTLRRSSVSGSGHRR